MKQLPKKTVKKLSSETGAETTARKTEEEPENENAPLSYAAFLKENGLNSGEEELIAQRKSAGSRYRGEIPENGVKAERVRDRGLDASGYADYLRDLAKERLTTALGSSVVAKTERKNAERYGAYLKKWESEQDKLMRAMFRKLRITDFPSREDAEREAVSKGLTPLRAEVVTKAALSYPYIHRKNGRATVESVGKALRYSTVSGDAALLFAMLYGLDEEEAKEAAAYSSTQK